MSPSSSRSPHLSNDIEGDICALTNVLAQLSVPRRTLSPKSPSKSYSRNDNGSKMYQHIATLLVHDDETHADFSVAGAAMPRHFELVAVSQASSPEPASPRQGDSSCAADVSAQQSESTIRVDARLQPPLDAARPLAAVLETGSHRVGFAQHVSDVTQLLLGFAALDLSEDERDERQTKCLVFLLQRCIGKLSERFHNPRICFPQSTPWWKTLTLWKPNSERFPVREFSARYHITLIFNALTPGLLSWTDPTVLDSDLAVKCVTSLAVLLDVIGGKIAVCTQSTCVREDWDRLNTTLRMLYSLLYESEILRHIFHNSSLSGHIFRSVDGSYSGEKCNGPFLYHQLEDLVGWHRALFMLVSTKVVRAAIPVKFNVISIPSSSAKMTPIMDLAGEIYPSRHHQMLLQSHLACRGALSESSKPEIRVPHYTASLVAFMMASESQEAKGFSGSIVGDPRTVREIREGVSEVINARAKCCYTCEKLASLLAVDASSPTDSTLCDPYAGVPFRPWTPPVGIPLEVLTLLREDLMSCFKAHLELAILEDQIISSTKQAPMDEYDFVASHFSVSTMLDTMDDYFLDA
ncbi:hypothetical protein R3P38DRAFT_2953252 [Favolaschia claudopus]|uniref:Uncharacterized protein n=1 Tax=Favolaschia claudopus TaxID=2862362 RepID=A0AAW0BHE5_9AGAR